MLCVFCPCLVYFSGSRVRIGVVVVVVEPGSFPQPRKNLCQESSRMSPDLIVEDALLEVTWSSMSWTWKVHLQKWVGFWPRCWYFPAFAALFTLSAVTEQWKRLG